MKQLIGDTLMSRTSLIVTCWQIIFIKPWKHSVGGAKVCLHIRFVCVAATEFHQKLLSVGLTQNTQYFFSEADYSQTFF